MTRNCNRSFALTISIIISISCLIHLAHSQPASDFTSGQVVLANIPLNFTNPSFYTNTNTRTQNIVINGVNYLWIRGTTGSATLAQSFNLAGYSNVALLLVLRAQGLLAGGFCRVDYAYSSNGPWVQNAVLTRDQNNYDTDRLDTSAAVYLPADANGKTTLFVRFTLSPTTSTGVDCQFRSVAVVGVPSGTPISTLCTYDCPPVGNGPSTRTLLPFPTLNAASPVSPTAPVDNSAFLIPTNAQSPTNYLSASFSLDFATAPASNTKWVKVVDTYTYTGTYPDYFKLPDVTFTLQQVGTHIVPCVAQNLRSSHSLYEIIIVGGRVWNEAADSGWSRVSLAFSLTQRNANCAWNGMMTFLFRSGVNNQISNVYYQLTQETCYYFKFNMWGIVKSTNVVFVPNACPTSRITNFQNWRANLMPSAPLNAKTNGAGGLATALSGVDYNTIPSTKVTNLSATSIYYNGKYYSDLGASRSGNTTYPIPEYLVLPTYSVAKTFITYVLFLRFAQKYPALDVFNIPAQTVLPPAQCSAYGTMSLANVISMYDNRYSSSNYMQDEDSTATTNYFFLKYTEQAKATFGCTRYNLQNSNPVWVYHTADIFIGALAMKKLVFDNEGGKAIKKFWVDEIITPFKMSEVFADIRTTYDTWNNPALFGGWGGFALMDDVMKMTELLNFREGKTAAGVQWLQSSQLLESLQRSGSTLTGNGVPITSLQNNPTSNPSGWNYRYTTSVWAIDLYRNSNLTCAIRYCPDTIGFGGITVAYLPNRMTYAYFSDNGEFSWAPAALSLSGASDAVTGVVQSPCAVKKRFAEEEEDFRAQTEGMF